MSTKTRFICRIVLPLLLLLLAAAPSAWAANPLKITVFYTSDTHGSIFSEGQVIGLDLLAALKKAEDGAILLDAGDFLNGEVAASFDKGRSVLRLMKLAGYDAATAGNHELAHGLDALLERYAEASEPPGLALLSANIFRLDEGQPMLDPGVILERQGLRIGIFGLTVPQDHNALGIRYIRPRAAAAGMVYRLRMAGCDLVIGLTHLGNYDEYPENSLTLDGLPGLDLVIDGHSHKKRDLRLPLGLALFSPGSGGRDVGRMVISYNPETKAVAALQNSLLDKNALAREYPHLKPDMELGAALAELNATLDAQLSGLVGVIPAALEAERETLRTSQTALGAFYAEGMRAGYQADIALLNSGSIRGGLPEGAVTERDLLGSLPFGGDIVEFAISGRELMEVLEHSLSALPRPSGAYLQIAGISLLIKPENPLGARLAAALLPDGSALDPAREYRVVVNAYMGGGGDGYHWFVGKEPLRPEISMHEAVKAHMQP